MFALQLQEREQLYSYCQGKLQEFADAHNCRLLQTPGNPISLALTLDNLLLKPPNEESSQSTKTLSVTYLGSMLFSRCISGTRVICRGVKQTVAGTDFTGYGSHCDSYPHNYLTCAAAVGTSKREVDTFVARLEKAFETFSKQQARVK